MDKQKKVYDQSLQTRDSEVKDFKGLVLDLKVIVSHVVDGENRPTNHFHLFRGEQVNYQAAVYPVQCETTEMGVRGVRNGNC